MAIFGSTKWPKLISRKIWVAENSSNFHIMYSQSGSPGLYGNVKIFLPCNFFVNFTLHFHFFHRLHMFKNNLSPNNPNNLYVQDIHARTATIMDRSMKIYRIENLGSCCWEAYSKSHFTGERETIFKKHDNAPKIQKLKTARVVIC